MVKVAYLVRPADGGMKTHLLGLLSALDRTQFEPVVICPPGTPLAKEIASSGITVYPLDIVDGFNPIKDFQAASALRSLLRNLQPDILHMHGAKAGLVGRMLLGTHRRPKTILTYHSYVFDERVSPLMRSIFSIVERRQIRVTDQIITVSSALKDELVTEMRLPADMIRVIYNGVTFSDIPPIPHHDIRIGAIARLAPQKGVEFFIRAAALVMMKFPQATFVVIGDGPLKTSLTQLTHVLGIHEGVYFMGKRHDIHEQLAKLDIVVQPSTRESFGLTIVEALSHKLPVVASRVGGIPEIIQDGKTGLLVKPADPTAIADAIIRLLDDREYAHQMGEAGNIDVRSRFSLSRMIEATQAVYTDVMMPVTRRKARR